MTWHARADEELLGALIASGVFPRTARDLVDDRRTAGAAHRITEVLGDLEFAR